MNSARSTRFVSGLGLAIGKVHLEGARRHSRLIRRCVYRISVHGNASKELVEKSQELGIASTQSLL